MVNRYRKGYLFELKVKKAIERYAKASGEKILVLRCAGSKPYDLIVLRKGYKPLLIECKTGEYSDKEIDFKRNLAEQVGCDFALVTPENLKRFIEYAKNKFKVLYQEIEEEEESEEEI